MDSAGAALRLLIGSEEGLFLFWYMRRTMGSKLEAIAIRLEAIAIRLLLKLITKTATPSYPPNPSKHSYEQAMITRRSMPPCPRPLVGWESGWQ